MLLSFKKQFASKVQDGSKRHTVRRQGKRQYTPGMNLHCCTGARTKYFSPIKGKYPVKCVKTERIEIETTFGTVTIDGKELPRDAATKLALADGFNNISDFFEFFKSQLTPEDNGIFPGVLIHW